MRRDGRRNRGLELGVLMLVGELCNIGYDAIPPVTLFTVVGQILLYTGIIDVPWDKWDVCISANKVWFKRDYKALLLNTFEHADDMHLYYNMVSYLVKGRTLEYMYGSANFFLLLVLLCIATPAIYVGLAIASAAAFEDSSIMSTCAIGFSGVIFALKLITTLENPVGYTYVSGFRVGMKYAAWAELIAIHLLVPNASFMGHLAGILAGLLYLKTPLRLIIDSLLETITGRPMRHGTRRSSSSSYSYRFNGNDGFYQRRDSYGWRYE